ncbi:MAG: PAS domain S-box protein [Myxococcales bacterium]
MRPSRAPMVELSSLSTLRDELAAERALLDGLTRIAPLLTSELDSERLMQRLTEEATRLIGADFGAFFYNVIDPAGESYMLYTLAGVPREAFDKFGMPRNTAVFAPTFAGEGTVCSEDITRDPRFGKNAPHHGMPQGHLPVVSYLAVPVRDVSGGVLGGLFFGHAARARFGDRQARAAEAISAMAAPALANAKLFRKLGDSQAALRDANARYELVNDATREGLWFWDVATNSVDWNDALLESIGLSREQWGSTFAEWFERLHPDDQPLLKEALRAHLEDHVPYNVALFRLKHASGEFRWFTTVGQAVWDESGRPTRMAGSVRDVTDRKRAEDARLASELRFEQILDSVGDLIFCKDENLSVSYANAATRRYYGMTFEELRSITDVPFNQIDFTKQYNADDRDVFMTGRPIERLEEPNQAPTGEVRFFHTIKTPIFDATGKVVELVGVSRDVTERKRAADEQKSLVAASAILAQSIDYEQTLANVARAMVPVVADWCAIDILEDGKLRRVAVVHSDPNKVAMALALEERYPTPVDAPSGVPAVIRSGRSELVTHIPAELLAQLAQDEEHLRLIKELGLSSYVVVPMLAHNQVLGAISLVGEGTRAFGEGDLAFAEKLAKRAGAALENALLYREVRQLNETLEARVDERTTSLLEANRELEAFSYTVSHDLRAPIRHVSGFVDMLRAHAGASLDEKARHYLDTIKQAAVQMGSLIDGLLGFSRLGRVELSKRSVPLGGLSEAVVEELGPDLANRQIAWKFGALPTVSADPTMLRVVLSNLLSNAVKYTKHKPHAQIEVGAETRGREHVIWVKDDGAGFNMAYANKLFGVFQRLHSDKEFSGTGIGLATARRIINRHGGRIWAESELGRGATFYFTLPRLETDA